MSDEMSRTIKLPRQARVYAARLKRRALFDVVESYRLLREDGAAFEKKHPEFRDETDNAKIRFHLENRLIAALREYREVVHDR
jgi:hypothetical protein